MTQVLPVLARYSRSIFGLSTLIRSSSQHYLVDGRRHCISSGCAASYTTTTCTDQDQTPKKKKRKSRKSKAKEDSDVTSSDKSTSDVQKKKRKSKKKVLSDEEVMDSLIGPFIPFEGSVENDSTFHNADLCFERQDSPDGRFYHHQSSTTSYSFPSVTTVLDKTMDSSYPLLLWKRKLTELHGKKGFDAIRNNTLKSGIDFHKELETRLLKESKSQKKKNSAKSPKEESTGPPKENTSIEDSANEDFTESPREDTAMSLKEDPAEKESTTDGHESQEGAQDQTPILPPQYMQSVEHVLDDIGEVKALETSIAHLSLGYVGTFDCLAEYRGTLCLIDWKTSGKLKSSLADCYDYPLQAVAYAGAINQDPRIDQKVLNVLIVIAYADGTPAHPHFISHTLCQKYWLRWIQRLQAYQTQFSEDLSELIN